MIKQKRRLFSRQDLLFFLLLLLASMFLFWKCRYGFGNWDECFYLTVPYRLMQGDGLLQEEWHLSQMAGVLTLPFVSAFIFLTGSTEGLLLAMRYFTTLVQCCFAIFLYCQLRPLNWLAACFAAISYVLFIPFGVMALSYNSMGILFIILCSVLLLTAPEKANLHCYLAGLSYAAAVLCSPYLLLIFLGYLGVVVLRYAVRKMKKLAPDYSVWSIKHTCFVCAGAATAAILFGIFVLSRCSLSGIVQSLGPMLSDPEHPPIQWILKTKGFLVFMLRANPLAKYLYYGMGIVVVLYLLDRNRSSHKGIYTCIISIGILVLQYSFCRFNNYINTIMWSVNVFGAIIFVFTENSSIRKLFYTVWIPGILYAYCVYMGSNQEFYAIASAGAAASVGSCAMIGLYFSELFHSEQQIHARKIALGIMCLVMVFQISSQVFYRYSWVFWDGEMKEMTTPITDGIEKGLYTTEENYKQYYQDLACMDLLAEYDCDVFLHLSEKTWYYLHMDSRVSTYSAWLSGVSETTLDRLDSYYQINPHKIPDLVLVDPGYENIAQQFCERYAYTSLSTEFGTILTPQ